MESESKIVYSTTPPPTLELFERMKYGKWNMLLLYESG